MEKAYVASRISDLGVVQETLQKSYEVAVWVHVLPRAGVMLLPQGVGHQRRCHSNEPPCV